MADKRAIYKIRQSDGSYNRYWFQTHGNMVIEDATHRFATDTEKTNWNGKANAADVYTKSQVYTKTESNTTRTYTVTHSKSGTIHTLTGLPTTAGIYTVQFKATADFVEGNTFADNYTAKPNGTEVLLPDKAFVSGDIVSVVVDVEGKKLGFKLGGGGLPKFPLYDGQYDLQGDEKQGYMRLLTTGTLTVQSDMLLDVFLVGGGGSGGYGYAYGGGGGGGYTATFTKQMHNKNTTIAAVIGAGGVGKYPSGNRGGTTSFGSLSSAGGYSGTDDNGGNGGSGGAGQSNNASGGTNGGNGAGTGAGLGQGTTTRPFGGDVAPFNTMLTYSGGGGGAGSRSPGGTGGAVGGGRGGYFISSGEGGDSDNYTSPTAGGVNTGGGGGGAYQGIGATGGSGIIIIRWGY